ncbi:uncharacterized protein LOC114575402 [Exaiptasia diaphana]|uniref:Uncharacterized protein n=1 Tax=Exaiptasia diaphana TaxID=2652724 RepID=A0A913YLJ5_EXADI|nr:uncharacterized protein LOC114575402 [Exaiptasia diaphana]
MVDVNLDDEREKFSCDIGDTGPKVKKCNASVSVVKRGPSEMHNAARSLKLSTGIQLTMEEYDTDMDIDKVAKKGTVHNKYSYSIFQFKCFNKLSKEQFRYTLIKWPMFFSPF